MAIYVLLGLSFSLVGVVGLQFFYLTYVEWLRNEQIKRIKELERRTKYLENKLDQSKQKLDHQSNFINSLQNELINEKDLWAEVIEDA